MDRSALLYTDEKDRSLGLAGMAVSMVVWEGKDMLAEINIDAEPGKGMTFTPDFHFSGNPRMSARIVWHQMIKQYELSTAMLLGNIMCRSYIGKGHSLSSSVNSLMRAMARDEGKEVCSLDDDEINHIYEKTFNYLERIFTHHAVLPIIDEFSTSLIKRRKLSATEAFELLDALQ